MPKDKHKEKAGAAKKKKRRLTGLGKGLDALFPDIDLSKGGLPGRFFECDIEMIRPNPYQPRRNFPEDELSDLADSIKTQGILQPLMVRETGDGYELIAGERRLRAARLAGLFKVPVIIKDIKESELLELSIIENIQRRNLNPMEEAEAYLQLMKEFKLTQDKIAKRVGKSRSSVANFLRLNQLPGDIKSSLKDGLLSMGHARALLSAETTALQRKAWKIVILRGLSVRETESLVQRLNAEKPKKAAPAKSGEDVYFSSIASDLAGYFGTKVQIRRRGQKGKVEIEFYSNDDLDRLLSLLRPG